VALQDRSTGLRGWRHRVKSTRRGFAAIAQQGSQGEPPPLQRWLARRFDADGPNYLIGCLAFLIFEVVLVIVPGTAIFPARYEGLGLAEYLRAVAVIDAIAFVLLGSALIAHRRGIGALVGWARTRDRAQAARARAFAFDGPRQMAVLAMAIGIPFLPVMVAMLAVPSRHTTPLDWIELAIGASMSVLIAGLNIWFSLDVLWRPVRVTLHGPPANARPASLLARLALVIPVAIWIAAFAVGYLSTTRAQAGPGHLMVVYAIAFGCACFSMMIVAPLFMGGVVDPMRELAGATRAAATGRLDVRVPITATDELGRLAASFNRMLDEVEAARVRIVTAADAARRKVERDLHDGAQQQLVLLKLKVSLLARDPSRTELLSEISGDLDRALAGLRDLARGIYPPLLESEGLRGALADATERAPIPAAVDMDGIGRYPAELEAAVYFCCLEALQNSAKHAGDGARAGVTVAERAGTLRFEITDTGRGFDPAAAHGSSGLQNMTDRIAALGGTLAIDSAPGRGARVQGSVPLRQPD
jgi:signal transduction histidine kinase